MISYVDNSTNLISSKNVTDLNLYINSFYKLLESYYKINFFKLNADKTTLLITCQPKYRRLVSDFIINANQFIIKQSKKIKILGVYYTAGLDNSPNVSNIIQKVTYRMNIKKT